MNENTMNAIDWEGLLTKGADIIEKGKRVQQALKQPKAPRAPVIVQQPAPLLFGLTPLQLTLAAVAIGGAVWFMMRKRR